MNVLRLSTYGFNSVRNLFEPFGLAIEEVGIGMDIPGSHWGEEEAGLIENTLYARPDTPVHSVLHEGCHWLLMDDKRKAALHTNAGGTMMEENAVCFLQILLADRLNDLGQTRMMNDMDAWGYSFRLGSTQAWFENDAEDAYAYLRAHPMSHALNIDVS